MLGKWIDRERGRKRERERVREREGKEGRPLHGLVWHVMVPVS